MEDPDSPLITSKVEKSLVAQCQSESDTEIFEGEAGEQSAWQSF